MARARYMHQPGSCTHYDPDMLKEKQNSTRTWWRGLEKKFSSLVSQSAFQGDGSDQLEIVKGLVSH